MNRAAIATFSFVSLALGVACGGNVDTPVGSTGSGAGTGGASSGGAGGGSGAASNGGTTANGGSGGTGGSIAKGGSGGSVAKGGSGGTGGTGGAGGSSAKGGSGGTGGSSAKGGSSGSSAGGASAGCLPDDPSCTCATDADCVQVQSCEICPDGSGICDTVLCQSGVCKIQDAVCAGSCAPAKPAPDNCDCIPQGPAGYYWDGSVCTELVACCAKLESGKLYATQASCKADHLSCDACGPTTVGPDPCDCDPGKKVYYWNGQSCDLALVCCPTAAGKLYDSQVACQSAHEGCGSGPACKQDGDCPELPCAPCPGGGGNCPVGKCASGSCVYSGGGECHGATCKPECSNGCAYPDKLCGKNGGIDTSVCLPTPKCAPTYEPVCGCDGNVHTNACIATSAGVDTSLLGNCVAPVDTFACGDHFCAKGKQYCQRLASDVGGFASDYACRPIPAACDSPGGGGGPCSCFQKEPCGASCQPDAEGYITLTCPGG